LLCNLPDFLCIQTVIILEEQIVELPELTLSLRGNGGNRRRPCKLVVSQRKVFEDKFHAVGIFLEHPLEYRHEPRAVGSLEIVEGGDHHWGVRVALERGARNVDLLDEIQEDDLNSLFLSTGE